MAFGLSSLLSPSIAQAAADALQEQTNKMAAFKAMALTAARDKIAASNKETGQNNLPTLEDYRQAFMANGDALQQMGIDPNSKQANEIAADLSGMSISGFELSDPKQSGGHHPVTEQMYDQDGDHAVSDFYNSISFANAKLEHCIVDPATSFNTELAEAASMNDVTFKNLVDGDEFRLGNGGKSSANFNGIHITNSRGGSITLDGATVNGMTITGNKVAELNLENGASINGLTATAGIVQLNGEAGTSIRDSHFTNTTISMSGKASGMILTDVTFTNTNMNGIDLSGANLARVTLPEGGINGVNLRGATLNRLQLDNGDWITSLQQLSDLGATVDKTTKIASNADDPILTQALSPQIERAASDPSPFAGLKGLEGLKLATAVTTDGKHVDHNDITSAIVPKTEEIAVKKAAEAPMDRGYYQKMSESGGAKPA